jgi:hypothetical protein
MVAILRYSDIVQALFTPQARYNFRPTVGYHMHQGIPGGAWLVIGPGLGRWLCDCAGQTLGLV